MQSNFTITTVILRIQQLGLILLFSIFFMQANAAIYYVRTSGNDLNTGTSWAQSFQTVQRALEVSVSGDEIWVAAGTYKPSISDRNISFYIPSGVRLYGGFAGNELNLSARDPNLIHTVNQTILSGDLDSNDSGFSNQSENSYRIVTFLNASLSTLLDGFTISGASNTQGDVTSGYGGAIFNNGSGNGNASNPMIRNCRFQFNSAFLGGAIYNNGISGGNASPSIENCSFFDNRSFDSGAAIANYGTFGNSSPSISGCFFIGNSAGFNSGVMNNHGFAGNSSPVITNSVFIGNFALNNGGVMVNTASSGGISNPVITNCSFSGNRAANLGGVIRNLEANVQISNSIIWGNSSTFNNEGGGVSASYSIIEGGYPGTGNLGSDPLFIIQPDYTQAPANIGNLQLNHASPGIDSGTNAGAPGVDILGNVRPYPGTVVDMGAYEFTPLNTCYADVDGDGFGNPASSQQFAGSCGVGYVSNNTDCNDNNPLEYPGQIWYADLDNDGYSSGSVLTQCLRPVGYKVASELIAINGDCNDSNHLIHPGATEICDGIDNNCNSEIDEDLVFITYYQDLDNDGYGNSNVTMTTCNGLPQGYAMVGGDCNDNNHLINPGATEICDGIDNNCNSEIDEGLELITYYQDLDNDGYGNSSVTMTTCNGLPQGYAVVGGDCNDGNHLINPGATEVCDGIDNNCNGQTDEGVTTRYYYDSDGDGFGVSASFQDLCAPSGFFTALLAGDCNDDDITIYPGAPELCDGKDNNCNGSTDEGNVCCPSGNVIYVDINATGANDGSSWANAFTHLQSALSILCDAPYQIWVAAGTYYPDLGPGQIDNSRNSRFQLKNGIKLYGGFSGTETLLSQRNWSANITTLSGDINQSGTISGNAYTVVYGAGLNQEVILDGFSVVFGNADSGAPGPGDEGGGIYFTNVLYTINNCIIENNRTSGSGAGGGIYMSQSSGSVINCVIQNNYGNNGGGMYIRNSPSLIIHSCIFRGNSGDTGSGFEVDAGVVAQVENCEFSQNAGNTGTGINVLGSTLSAVNCTFSGQRNNSNQGVLSTNFSSTLSVQNCILWNNRIGSVISIPLNIQGGSTISVSNSLIQNSGGSANWQLAGVVNSGGNIDTDPLFVQNINFDLFPNSSSDLRLRSCSPAINAGNNLFNSQVLDLAGNTRVVLGSIDMGAYEFQSSPTLALTCYADIDMDGYGNPAVSQLFCDTCGPGFVSNNTDCDDNNAAINPTTIWYLDADNDGYYTGSGVTQCLSPGAGYKYTGLIGGGDCDDSNADVNPGAEEICNGIDDDCNSLIDDGLPFVTYYADVDEDGYGDPNVSESTCDGAPEGYVTDNTDCDDTNADINPTTIWYFDADNDGYYTGTGITQCLSPGLGYKYTGLIGGGDCDDNNAEVNPGAEEICNGIDDDCNGIVDDLGGSTQGNWVNENIGNANGSAEYPPCDAESVDTFYIQSYGFGQPNNDTRHMVYQTLCGDMSISARVMDIKGGGWAGISMQENMAPGSKKAALKTQLTNLIFREIRLTTGANQNMQMLTRPQHKWLKLERIGNTFNGYTSNNGISWTFAFTASIPMNACIHIGLFAESTNNSNQTSVEIDQVNITGGQNQVRPVNNPSAAASHQPKSGLEVEAYPNPVNGWLQVRSNHGASISGQIQVLGLLGELLKEVQVDDLQAADNGIDMSGLPAGVYLLRVTTSTNEMVTKRIIKQ